MRILSIDYGKKRCGIAVSDPMKIIANGLTTVATHELFDWLKEYMKKEEVEVLIIGEPKKVTGEYSETMKYIEPLVLRLRRAYPDKEVVLHDERFTSVMAQRTILESGIGKMARRDKAIVDRVAATIILQSYMESINH